LLVLGLLVPALAGCAWLPAFRVSTGPREVAPTGTVSGLIAGASLDARTRHAATVVEFCSFDVDLYERAAEVATSPDEVFANAVKTARRCRKLASTLARDAIVARSALAHARRALLLYARGAREAAPALSLVDSSGQAAALRTLHAAQTNRDRSLALIAEQRRNAELPPFDALRTVLAALPAHAP
jgi:hypothetical protein